MDDPKNNVHNRDSQGKIHASNACRQWYNFFKHQKNIISDRGANKPGLMVLTTSLSRPLRHLEKYAGMAQELEQHLEDDHPDRGDTQRSVGFYKNVAVRSIEST